MTTALTIAAALWIGISLGIALAIVWSARHDQVWEDERPEWADDACPIDGDEADDLIYQQMCFSRWEAEL